MVVFKYTTKTFKIVFPFLSNNIFKKQMVHMGSFYFPDSRLYRLQEYRDTLVVTSVLNPSNIGRNFNGFYNQISL